MPFHINYLDISGGCLHASTSSIVAGLFINKPPSTSLSGINLSFSNAEVRAKRLNC